MQYMLLIYSAEGDGPQYGTPEFGPFMQGYQDFTKELVDNGKMVSGDALSSVNTATTVMVRDGKTETMDGPFAETKEQLGGYYLIDVENLDEALEYAAKIPTATYGRIEVRPIVIYD